MESIHFPIKDKWIPNSMDDLVKLVEKIIVRLRAGKKVVVHCNGGKGRSGTVLVATLVGLGRKVQQAIDVVRKTRSGTIQNPLQIAYVKRFKSAWIKHKAISKDDNDDSIDDPETDSSFEIIENPHKSIEIMDLLKTTKSIENESFPTPGPTRRMTVSTYKIDNIPNIYPPPPTNTGPPLPTETLGKSIRNFLSKNLTEAIDKKTKKSEKPIKKKDKKNKELKKKKESIDLIEMVEPGSHDNANLILTNNNPQLYLEIDVLTDTEESLVETTLQ